MLCNILKNYKIQIQLTNTNAEYTNASVNMTIPLLSIPKKYTTIQASYK